MTQDFTNLMNANLFSKQLVYHLTVKHILQSNQGYQLMKKFKKQIGLLFEFGVLLSRVRLIMNKRYMIKKKLEVFYRMWEGAHCSIVDFTSWKISRRMVSTDLINCSHGMEWKKTIESIFKL